MNKCVYFSLSVMVICQALVADATTKAAMKQATKEAKDLSKQQRESLIHKEQRLNSVESESDLLPESDRNKEFDVDAMHKQLKHPGEIAEGSELHCFLKTTAKREEFEGTEDFLLQGRLVIEDPEKYMGATAHVQHVQEEEKLEKCQENGIYQVSFNQKRIVQVTPEIKNKVKYCKGHERKKHFFWEKDADHRIKKEKKELSEDTTIASFKPSTTFTCTRTVSPISKLGADFFVKDSCIRSNRFMTLPLLPTSNRRAQHAFTSKFV